MQDITAEQKAYIQSIVDLAFFIWAGELAQVGRPTSSAEGGVSYLNSCLFPQASGDSQKAATHCLQDPLENIMIGTDLLSEALRRDHDKFLEGEMAQLAPTIGGIFGFFKTAACDLLGKQEVVKADMNKILDYVGERFHVSPERRAQAICGKAAALPEMKGTP